MLLIIIPPTMPPLILFFHGMASQARLSPKKRTAHKGYDIIYHQAFQNNVLMTPGSSRGGKGWGARKASDGVDVCGVAPRSKHEGKDRKQENRFRVSVGVYEDHRVSHCIVSSSRFLGFHVLWRTERCLLLPIVFPICECILSFSPPSS